MKYMHTKVMERGTTLIELILYLAITSGIMIGIGSVSLSVFQQREKAKVINEVRYNASMIISLIQNDIREGSFILSPLYPDTSSTTLIISSRETSKNPTIYQILSGTLYRTQGTNLPEAITTDVVVFSEYAFTKIGATGTPASLRVRGMVTAGEGTLGTSFRYEVPIEISTTVRAQQP